MLGETIIRLRKQRGLSQLQLADEMHVVRQTISKWEKNLSVPDADALSRLADVLDVSVSELLGAPVAADASSADIAAALSQINEQLAIQNRRRNRIWKVAAWVLGIYVAFQVLLLLLAYSFSVDLSRTQESGSITMEQNAVIIDEPTP
ncbi:MAG: helix-turn-helix transcriptional regulator [Clostridia bacterium]|nr:helix-turn-helix transcriptional regulator [Clostridia bacterium]